MISLVNLSENMNLEQDASAEQMALLLSVNSRGIMP